MENKSPWQAAKDQTLAMQLEIAHLFPEDKVVKINHKTTGTLLSCSDEQINWNGSAGVVLVEGTEIEPLVRQIEAHYQNSRFNIKTRIDRAGNYQVQLRSPDTAEIYIIGEWVDKTIRIASSSPCFVLPDDVDLPEDF